MEIIKELIQYIGIAFILWLPWAFTCLILHLVFENHKKFRITINFDNTKKFQDRLTPIYRVNGEDHSRFLAKDEYYIEKYEVQKKAFPSFWSALISPVPIYINKFRYIGVYGYRFVIANQDFITLKKEDIVEMWEEANRREMLKRETKLKVETCIEQKVKGLNDEFEKNYI